MSAQVSPPESGTLSFPLRQDTALGASRTPGGEQGPEIAPPRSPRGRIRTPSAGPPHPETRPLPPSPGPTWPLGAGRTTMLPQTDGSPQPLGATRRLGGQSALSARQRGRCHRLAARPHHHWRPWIPPLSTGPAPPGELGCGAGGGRSWSRCAAAPRGLQSRVRSPRHPPARLPWSPAPTAPPPPAPMPSARAGSARRAAYGPARPCRCRWSSCYTISARGTRISLSSAGRYHRRPAARPRSPAIACSPDHQLPTPTRTSRDSCPDLGPAHPLPAGPVLSPLPRPPLCRLCPPPRPPENCQKFL